MKKYINYIKCVIAFCLLFFGSLLKYIPIAIFKIDINNMSNLTSIYLSTFTNVICFIILILMYRKDIINGIKDLKEKKYKPLLDGFNYWFIALMIMVLSNTIISCFSPLGTSSNEATIRELLNTSWLTILSVAIISPVIEELVWRMSLYKIIKNKWAYIIASGIIFGALHVMMTPTTSIIDLFYLIPYCSMGVGFAYMQYKTGNILTSISMHVLKKSQNTIST